MLAAPQLTFTVGNVIIVALPICKSSQCDHTSVLIDYKGEGLGDLVTKQVVASNDITLSS
jgi:hypothetical protein